jgi:hypothetical protein
MLALLLASKKEWMWEQMLALMFFALPEQEGKMWEPHWVEKLVDQLVVEWAE